MENNNNHDRYFRELFSGNRKEMPFDDFEDEIMAEIRSEYEKTNSFVRNIRLSWVFFILGMISGIAIVVISIMYDDTNSVTGIIDNYSLVIIITLCLVILLFAEKLMKSTLIRDNSS